MYAAREEQMDVQEKVLNAARGDAIPVANGRYL